MVVLAIMAILGAVAIPALTSFYGECCIKTAMCELTDMIKEAKNNALNDGCDYAVGFNTNSGTISLLIGKGGDGKWNTDDDIVKRSFCLARKGGGLRFGYGDYGPPDGLAKASDGVSFSNNTLVCNPELTGSSGYGGPGFLGHEIVLNLVTKENEYGKGWKPPWCSGGRA